MIHQYDYLVIGSGIAGMSFALKVAEQGKSVAIICKTELEEANTYFAQGGIASVTNLQVDNFEKHIHDTLVAGDWINDRAAVEMVVRRAPSQIKELIRWGVDFDRNEDGGFDLHREGGHSEFRILHHKDNTGAEIQTSLIEAIKRQPNIHIFNHHFAVEIITQHHLGIIVTRYTPGIRCFGAYVLNEDTGRVDTFLSRITVMATGGCEAVYRNTTNPLVATGDGIADGGGGSKGPQLFAVQRRHLDAAGDVGAHAADDLLQRALDAVVDVLDETRAQFHAEGRAGGDHLCAGAKAGRLLVYLNGGAVAGHIQDLSDQMLGAYAHHIRHTGVRHAVGHHQRTGDFDDLTHSSAPFRKYPRLRRVPRLHAAHGPQGPAPRPCRG